MLQILVNMKQIQLLQPIPDPIVSIVINTMGPTHVQKGVQKAIAEWLYKLSQRVEKTIVYNGTIINKEDVKDVSSTL